MTSLLKTIFYIFHPVCFVESHWEYAQSNTKTLSNITDCFVVTGISTKPFNLPHWPILYTKYTFVISLGMLTFSRLYHFFIVGLKFLADNLCSFF